MSSFVLYSDALSVFLCLICDDLQYSPARVSDQVDWFTDKNSDTLSWACGADMQATINNGHTDSRIDT